MKRGDLASAQRRTERAFRLAAVMDEMFLQPGRLTWKDKPKAERKPSAGDLAPVEFERRYAQSGS
ncbi:hypothetical protein RZA67_03150 [Stenotrophomonas sp. C3(2023)]|uniref:hypothetical protein n=1 Tax=Stenotrophomonas sp. C3(2023) TaxID=3080277 RepID=UPI00293C88A0|nr:hypothetical protein [Stenotrophomonas sp. C3(2023)]MDV3467732.1 hypothetical protein [Stenotrophomonas sp. C3(2023)]